MLVAVNLFFLAKHLSASQVTFPIKVDKWKYKNINIIISFIQMLLFAKS